MHPTTEKSETIGISAEGPRAHFFVPSSGVAMELTSLPWIQVVCPCCQAKFNVEFGDISVRLLGVQVRLVSPAPSVEGSSHIF